MVWLEYLNKKYSCIIISSNEELEEAVNKGADIIQFDFITRETLNLQEGKFPVPKGYMYMSNRHIPYGGTEEYDKIPLKENEISLKFEVCFYKASLHGQINNILAKGKFYSF